MKSKFFLILVLGLLILPLYVQEQIQHTIVWDPDRIELKGFPGTSSIAQATFTANQDLSDVELWIVSELGQFIEVEPNHFEIIKGGVPYSVQLFLSLPSYSALGGYEGTLHIREGKRTLPQSLKISLFVEMPTSEIIPEEIAIPSEDRLFKDPETESEFVSDEIVLIFIQGTSEENIKAIVKSVNGVFLGYIQDINLYQIQVLVNEPNDLNQIIEQLKMESSVSVAGHHWIGKLREPPNDPMGAWDEDNPEGKNWGQELIYLPSAWEITTGDQDIMIGVVDNGFYRLSDFEDNIFEINPENLKRSHGTEVASIIGAQGNNGKGIAGVMWDCSLLLYSTELQRKEEEKDVGFSHVAYCFGIIWTIRNGAKVINCSWGWIRDKFPEQDDFEEMISFWENVVNHYSEILFVCAAGNEGVDAKYDVFSNLAIKYDNVISVAAVDRNGNLSWGSVEECPHEEDWWGSNFGEYITVASPGGDGNRCLLGEEDIYTLAGYDEGTSFAAPFATGLAGLIWSINIDHIFTACQVKKYIEAGAKIGSKKVDNQPFYIINAYESLRLASNFNPTTNVNPQSAPHGTQFHLEWSGFTPNSTLTSHLKKPDGTLLPTRTFNTDSQGNASHTIDSTGFAEGPYEHGAVDDCSGRISDLVTFTITTADNPPDIPTLIAPDHNVWINYDPVFKAQVSDHDGGMVRAYFDIIGYGGGFGTWVESGGISEWGPVNLGDYAQYSWRAKAEDDTGLESGWYGYWVVKVDK